MHITVILDISAFIWYIYQGETLKLRRETLRNICWFRQPEPSSSVKILNYVNPVGKIRIKLLQVVTRNYILFISNIGNRSNMTWSLSWAVFWRVRNTNCPSVGLVLCLLCVYYIFKHTFPPLIPKIGRSNFTYTLLQYHSFRFVDIFIECSCFRACLRRFLFSFLTARRSRPTTMASVRSFSSRNILFRTAIRRQIHTCITEQNMTIVSQTTRWLVKMLYFWRNSSWKHKLFCPVCGASDVADLFV